MKAFTIINATVLENLIRFLRSLPLDRKIRVTIREARRSDDQNAKMWAMLTDISNQVVWCGQKWTKDDWKEILSAYLVRQRFVPQINDDGQPGGGLVALGARTREFSIKDMGHMIDACEWFGAMHGVVWTDPNEFAAPRDRGAKASGAGARAGGEAAEWGASASHVMAEGDEAWQ